MRFRSLSRSPSPVVSNSPPASVASSPRKLGFAEVANLFLKMRSLQDQAKEHHIDSASGDPKSHPGLAPEPESSKTGLFKYTDIFVCIGGVNVHTLLRATRSAVVEQAEAWGANALVDEQCVVSCWVSSPVFS